jgi:hypothetical protein
VIGGLGPTAASSLPSNSRFDPRSALRAQSRLFGEGRGVPVGQVGVSNRRQCPHCRRAPFDPRSALPAKIRIAGEERRVEGSGWSELS